MSEVISGKGADGLVASSLDVCEYRCFDRFHLSLAPHVTLLVGHNAVGKTNLVEALQLLTAGLSFRRPAPAEMIREGCSSARAELAIEGDGRLINHAVEIESGKRLFFKNGKRTTGSGVRGVLPSVLFCPDHLDMVKRSARMRRDALDGFGVQLNATYNRLLSTYERTVEQRNSLLRTYPTIDVLEAWDESLCVTGAALLLHRRALLDRLRRHFIEVYRIIAPYEQVDMEYQATIGVIPDTREEAARLFAEVLRKHRDDEIRRCLTLVGPHRDEIVFTIDGRSARDYGSQGQQRSIVLAWKIAEVRVTRDILGYYPLLLLDDVMSELDSPRRDAIMGFIGDKIQTVITTTNLGYFTSDVLNRAEVVRIGEDL